MAKKKRSSRLNGREKSGARMAVASGLSFKEASRLVGVAEHEIALVLKDIPDDTFQEMQRVMARALAIKGFTKAMAVMDTIDPENLEKTSPVAKATIIGILVDKVVDKLQVVAGLQEERPMADLNTVENLISSVQSRISRLKLQETTVQAQLDSSPPPPVPEAELTEIEASDNEPPSSLSTDNPEDSDPDTALDAS